MSPPTTADHSLTCRGKGSRRIDPDNLHLTLALDLSAFGPLRIDLSVSQKQASCCIDTDEKAAFIQAASDELKAALEECGYTVADIASRVAKPAQTDPPTDSPPTVGVDFRV